ncbi:MAG: DNA repair protein RecO [Lachnospiraceae bacterium]|nr:DNA repair protein RecO [Lachnospiraceae bacterium]
MEVLKLHGVVLKCADHSEFDRRLTVLTAERGKITVFARSVKRPGNRLMASTEPFAFGTFLVTEGKSAYNLRETEIDNYFEEIRSDLDAFYLGSYFLEFADYYSRENVEDLPLLSLIYSSLLALLHPDFHNELVRAVFEIKMISVEGELPPPDSYGELLPGTRHALEHILKSPSSRVFTFNVNEEILSELSSLAAYYVRNNVRKEFQSLKILNAVSVR